MDAYVISTSDRGLRQDALVLTEELTLAGFQNVTHVVPRVYGDWGTRPKRQEIEIPGLGPHAVVFFLEVGVSECVDWNIPGTNPIPFPAARLPVPLGLPLGGQDDLRAEPRAAQRGRRGPRAHPLRRRPAQDP